MSVATDCWLKSFKQKTSSEKKSFAIKQKKVFRKSNVESFISIFQQEKYFASVFPVRFPLPLKSFEWCKEMHAFKTFLFLDCNVEIVIKKKRKQPYPRCLSKLSFILKKKKKLKSLSKRRKVFHNIQEIGSFLLYFPLCGWSGRGTKINGKLHKNDVFRFLVFQKK